MKLSIDCVVFGYTEGVLKVALIQRKNPPFGSAWALPGGFLEGNETVEEAAVRELKEETGIEKIYLEQCGVFSDPARDPRGRVVTVAFFALVNSDQFQLLATEDAAAAKWVPLSQIPPLAFDHGEIFAKALEALRTTFKIKPLLFELLPQQFTLTQVQTLYEQIYGEQMDKRNFRKRILNMDLLVETDEKTSGEKHRPAMLYQVKPSYLRRP